MYRSSTAFRFSILVYFMDHTVMISMLNLSSVIGRHNDDDSEYHLDSHQMVCIAYKTDGS